MKLYYFPLSTYSQKVLTALYEKGAEFESEQVRLFDEAERERYREIYPLGRIPLLVLDDGHLIPESSIIVEYLDTNLEGGPAADPVRTGRGAPDPVPRPHARPLPQRLDRLAPVPELEARGGARPGADRTQPFSGRRDV